MIKNEIQQAKWIGDAYYLIIITNPKIRTIWLNACLLIHNYIEIRKNVWYYRRAVKRDFKPYTNIFCL